MCQPTVTKFKSSFQQWSWNITIPTMVTDNQKQNKSRELKSFSKFWKIEAIEKLVCN